VRGVHAAWVACGGMTSPFAPTSLDHVALWVSDRDAIAALACDHLGMHEIERTDKFTLVGADARGFKLTLFAAEGPREAGALEAIVLRVAGADSIAAAHDAPVQDGIAFLDAGDGLRLGLVEGEPALDHVVLRVEDPEASASALADLGFERTDGGVSVAGKEIRLLGGGAPEGERPLLNHLAVLVESAAAVEEAARARGAEVADVVDAKNTLAVFLWTPGRIKVEYVEHKPSFSLV
jgi:catechol 2,3-dioxygenase-like lactoylglutathione lyase family enzyme